MGVIDVVVRVDEARYAWDWENRRDGVEARSWWGGLLVGWVAGVVAVFFASSDESELCDCASHTNGLGSRFLMG